MTAHMLVQGQGTIASQPP